MCKYVCKKCAATLLLSDDNVTVEMLCRCGMRSLIPKEQMANFTESTLVKFEMCAVHKRRMEDPNKFPPVTSKPRFIVIGMGQKKLDELLDKAQVPDSVKNETILEIVDAMEFNEFQMKQFVSEMSAKQLSSLLLAAEAEERFELCKIIRDYLKK